MQLLQKALADADPLDVSSFSRTCKAAWSFCQNATLYKELFLSLFDPPTSSSAFPYRSTLEARIRARTWLSPKAIDKLKYSPDDREATLRALVDIAKFRLAHTSPLPSLSQLFLSTYFQHDNSDLSFLHLSASPLSSQATRQTPAYTSAATLLSHLHVLSTPHVHALASPHVRTKAREVVYERLNFLGESKWGPFKSDGSGRVSWTKVEALAIVMGANLRDALADDWGDDEKEGVELPEGWESTRGGEPAEKAGETSRDWAGVEATSWVGTYSFLDFRVWEHYNLHRRSGYHPTLEGEGESVGDCMSLKLNLLPPGYSPASPAPTDDSIDSDDSEYAASLGGSGSLADADDSPPTSLSDPSPSLLSPPSPTLLPSTSSSTTPPLFFDGTTAPLRFEGTFSHAGLNSSNNPSRSIKGSVRKTPDGEVHWTYVIRYGGADQWAMNGVQVGGARSKFGVLGTWTTANHEDGGPNGPFWCVLRFGGNSEQD